MTCPPRRSIFQLLLLFSLSSLPGLSPCHGAVLTVLHTFAVGGPGRANPSEDKNADGARPEAPLIQGRDGALYGTASSGGSHGTGVIFRINTDGTGFVVLHSFGPLEALFIDAANADGAWPSGALTQARDGTLFGAARQGGPRGGGTVFGINTDGTGLPKSFMPSVQGEKCFTTVTARGRPG